MPRGSQPGERRGGRRAGTPNKDSVLRKRGEAAARAAAQIAGADPKTADLVAASPAAKLLSGKEILTRFSNLYAGLAAFYQPYPQWTRDERTQKLVNANPNYDEERFLIYSKLACQAGDRVADFTDPRYRAIAVAMTPGEGQAKDVAPTAEPTDPKERERWAAASYLKLVKG